jgi:hypothetical protein
MSKCCRATAKQQHRFTASKIAQKPKRGSRRIAPNIGPEDGQNLPPPTEAAYFSPDETDPNVVFRFVPVLFKAPMIATAIPDAMSPYSMAVAPDSSARNAFSFRRTSQPSRNAQSCPKPINVFKRNTLKY